MPFEFYPENLWMMSLIMLPNLLFLFFPPKQVPQQNKVSFFWKILLLCEKVGQMSIFVLPVFWEVKVSEKTPYLLVAMSICLLIYYAGWIQYYIQRRKYRYLFTQLLFIPVPMAVSPVFFFIFGALLIDSWPLIIGTLILAMGHIPESYRQLRLSMQQ